MINTYKESSLHKSLKELYALNINGRTEVECEGYIYDILTDDGNIIEIQTQNLGKLLKKIQDAISHNKKCTIVHPVIIKKNIETYSQEGNLIKKTVSPKKENEYTLLKDLTGIWPVLLNELFSLEVPFIEMTEERLETKNLEQSENKKRRFKKNWQKSNKRLVEIKYTKNFHCKEDYLALLPENLPREFKVSDLSKLLKEDKSKAKNASKYAGLLAWLYNKTGLIKQIGKEGKAFVYKIK